MGLRLFLSEKIATRSGLKYQHGVNKLKFECQKIQISEILKILDLDNLNLNTLIKKTINVTLILDPNTDPKPDHIPYPIFDPNSKPKPDPKLIFFRNPKLGSLII